MTRTGRHRSGAVDGNVITHARQPVGPHKVTQVGSAAVQAQPTPQAPVSFLDVRKTYPDGALSMADEAAVKLAEQGVQQGCGGKFRVW